MKGTKRKISLVIFFSKKLHVKLLNSKTKKKKKERTVQHQGREISIKQKEIVTWQETNKYIWWKHDIKNMAEIKTSHYHKYTFERHLMLVKRRRNQSKYLKTVIEYKK